jgi:hypothetical protein
MCTQLNTGIDHCFTVSMLNFWSSFAEYNASSTICVCVCVCVVGGVDSALRAHLCSHQRLGAATGHLGVVLCQRVALRTECLTPLRRAHEARPPIITITRTQAILGDYEYKSSNSTILKSAIATEVEYYNDPRRGVSDSTLLKWEHKFLEVATRARRERRDCPRRGRAARKTAWRY